MLTIRPGQPGHIKAMLYRLVKEEIDELSECGSGLIPVVHTSESLPEKLLQTPLSVAQLGLFIRLLVEGEIIKSENNSMLLRWIAASFKTKRTEVISAESLRIKYYAADQASVNIVREYLLRMMNQLKKC